MTLTDEGKCYLCCCLPSCCRCVGCPTANLSVFHLFPSPPVECPIPLFLHHRCHSPSSPPPPPPISLQLYGQLQSQKWKSSLDWAVIYCHRRQTCLLYKLINVCRRKCCVQRHILEKQLNASTKWVPKKGHSRKGIGSVELRAEWLIKRRYCLIIAHCFYKFVWPNYLNTQSICLPRKWEVDRVWTVFGGQQSNENDWMTREIKN